MKKFNYLFNAFQDLFVGLAVTLTVTVSLKSFVDVKSFLIDVLVAFVINYITGLIVNTHKIAVFMARKIKVNTDGKAFTFLQVLVNTSVYVTVISICMFIMKVGFTQTVWVLLKQLYFRLIVVAYIVGYIMAPVSGKITSVVIRTFFGGEKDV